MSFKSHISILCRKDGIALLYAVIFIGVVMTLTLLTQNIVLKLIVSGRAEHRGVYAYYVADAAVECIRYLDGYYYGYEMSESDSTGGFLRHTGQPAYCYGLNGSLNNTTLAGSQDVFGADICANGTSGTLFERIQSASIPVLRILIRRTS